MIKIGEQRENKNDIELHITEFPPQSRSHQFSIKSIFIELICDSH